MRFRNHFHRVRGCSKFQRACCFNIASALLLFTTFIRVLRVFSELATYNFSSFFTAKLSSN